MADEKQTLTIELDSIHHAELVRQATANGMSSSSYALFGISGLIDAVKRASDGNPSPSVEAHESPVERLHRLGLSFNRAIEELFAVFGSEVDISKLYGITRNFDEGGIENAAEILAAIELRREVPQNGGQAAKAFHVLVAHHPKPLSLTEIESLSGLTRAQVIRVVSFLKKTGIAIKEGDSWRWTGVRDLPASQWTSLKATGAVECLRELLVELEGPLFKASDLASRMGRPGAGISAVLVSLQTRGLISKADADVEGGALWRIDPERLHTYGNEGGDDVPLNPFDDEVR